MTGFKKIKKEKLVFEDGKFFHKNKLVAIEPEVAKQLDNLEELIQMFDFVSGQPGYCAGRTLEGFERKSVKEPVFRAVAQTPTIDAEMEKSRKIREEYNELDKSKQANQLSADFDALIRWTQSDKVLVSDPGFFGTMSLDLYTIGNPLELTFYDVISIIERIAGSDEFNIYDAEMDRIIAPYLKAKKNFCVRDVDGDCRYEGC